MAFGLEEQWQKPRLTVEEEKVAVADDEDNAEKNEHIALCLLGSLHTDGSFNAKAMNSVFRNI